MTPQKTPLAAAIFATLYPAAQGLAQETENLAAVVGRFGLGGAMSRGSQSPAAMKLAS